MTHLTRSTRRPAILALAIGLVLLGCATTAPAPAPASHGTEALLLTCMDYRLTDDTSRYMEGRGLHDRYDHVVLAGAALGVNTEQRPAWGQTFWEHLDVALQLHHVKKVMVLDHRDCGAYKTFLGEDFAAAPSRETEIHSEKLRLLRDQIVAKHPELKVELLLMSLDGAVETVR